MYNPLMCYDYTESPAPLPELKIPELALLPAATDSVTSLLQFRGLTQATSCANSLVVAEQNHTSAWFAEASPDDGFDPITKLLQWPLPSPILIRQLIDKLALQNPGHEVHSIIPAHLSDSLRARHLPLWVLTYWVDASEAQSAQTAWKKAVKWMETHC